MENAEVSGKKVKQKAEAIAYDQEQRKVMLTVQGLRGLRSVKNHHVQTLFRERSGNAEGKNQ